MMDAADATYIHFQGSPRNLQGLVSMAFQEVVSAGLPRLELKAPPPEVGTEPPNLQIESAGHLATWLRFALSDATPPGSYEGTVSIGDEQYASVIEVNPRLSLIISPRRLTLQGTAGAELAAKLTVVNAGNVAFEIPKLHKIGLLDVKGAERAIGVALRDTETSGERRIGLFAEELSRSHAGRLTLTVEWGEGLLLSPGECRRLSIALRLPDGLKGGRIYAGEWMLLNRSYSIEVQAMGDVPAQGES